MPLRPSVPGWTVGMKVLIWGLTILALGWLSECWLVCYLKTIKGGGTSLEVQWLRMHLPTQGLIPGWGAKIPHAAGQRSPWTATAEPAHHS